MSTWSCFSNHGQVLLLLAQAPDLRQRDLAAQIGITERAVSRLVRELVEFGVVIRERHGRRMHYTVQRDLPLPYPLAEGAAGLQRTVGDLVDLLQYNGAVPEGSDRAAS